jgi:hypothetical protein
VQFFRTLAERGDGDGAERIVEAVHDYPALLTTRRPFLPTSARNSARS